MTLQEIEAAHPGFKEFCRASFIGNECDSDEYRETQPRKGLEYIADYFTRVGSTEGDVAFLRLVEKWLHAVVEGDEYGYAGAEELSPVLYAYFDVLWDQGEHPYSSADEMDQYELAWFLESEQA